MDWKIEGCSKTWGFEADGYCTSCGRNHLKLQKKRGTTKHQHSVNVAKILREEQAIRNYNDTIENTPHYKAARDTVLLLADIYGFDVKVVFRNIQGADCAMKDYEFNGYKNVCKTNKFTIRFGYECLDRFAKNGYSEYARLQYIVDGKPKGEEAGVWIAMHEFAHAVDFAENGRRRGAMHPVSFHNAYREVIDLVN